MSFLASLFGGKPAAPSSSGSRQASFQPQLEVLEGREVPAVVSSELTPLLPAAANTVLSAADVGQLLQRAAASTSRTDAIIAIMDRSGNLLGTRVESGVAANIQNNPKALAFAIDGAMSEARTAAYFANNQAPLTSRTIGFISQSTVTQREVESNPLIQDPTSTISGPGLVAPIRDGGHFPPAIPFTPQVDLMAIEHTNRNTSFKNVNGVLTAVNDEFNIPPAFVNGTPLVPQDSYDFLVNGNKAAVGRGIGTLPGGIPIYKNGTLVGGIGVFFPGTNGFADQENSSLSSNYDPTKPDLSLVAEYMAFAAVGGSAGTGHVVGTINGIAPVSGISLPAGRIDLVGITLDIFGPGGTQGPQVLATLGLSLGVGDPNNGTNVKVDAGGNTLLAGKTPPTGWLVLPHDGVGVSSAMVTQMIAQGIAQAQITRAAIRLPLGTRTEMVFAVADKVGNILGLFRMPDATIFSIDVAVAKSRNVSYYDDPAMLLSIDQVPGLPKGVSMTNRTFRYLAQARFPEGIDGKTPGPFSILNAPGINLLTATNTGDALPASAYDGTVYGFDSFHPGTNFHAQTSPLNQNGIVFFPGSSGVYLNNGTKIVGGFGVSGDGVDQDDVVTTVGNAGYAPAANLRADSFFFRNIRLPYNKFLRNPEG